MIVDCFFFVFICGSLADLCGTICGVSRELCGRVSLVECVVAGKNKPSSSKLRIDFQNEDLFLNPLQMNPYISKLSFNFEN